PDLPGGLGRDELALVAELLDHVGDTGGGSVVQGDGVAVAGEVSSQVSAHHAESGDADLRGCLPCGGHLLRLPLPALLPAPPCPGYRSLCHCGGDHSGPAVTIGPDEGGDPVG